MANRYFNPVVKPSESGATGNFAEGAAPVKPTRFTSGGHMPPTHNAPQPHCDLPEGEYTHSAARKAANEVTGKQMAPARKPGTQATLETPAPSMTAKSAGQKASRAVVGMSADQQGKVTMVNPPKGK